MSHNIRVCHHIDPEWPNTGPDPNDLSGLTHPFDGRTPFIIDYK